MSEDHHEVVLVVVLRPSGGVELHPESAYSERDTPPGSRLRIRSTHPIIVPSGAMSMRHYSDWLAAIQTDGAVVNIESM